MKLNLIGAGRLGKNIALALSSAQLISSLTISNRNQGSAHQACKEIGSGVAVNQIQDLPEADVIWISCNDDAIPHTVKILADTVTLKPGCFIIHSSGVLNSSLLAPLKEKGCSVASFHPLKAFKTNYLDANAFCKVDCVLEGDKEVCHWLKQAFTRLDAHVTAIQAENKAIYHAAACIASNYLITLAACSEELFLQAGLPPEQSRRMLINLMQGNLTNLQQTKLIAESLTGPLARGDNNTLALHLNSIKNSDMLHLYKAAGLASLHLTDLSEEQQNYIKNLLAEA